MAGVRPRFERGSPLTFSANANIRGGRLVDVDGTTGRVKEAGAASATCLGVATGDASPPNYSPANTTDAWGNPTVNHGLNPPNEVAVANQGVWDLLHVAGAAAPLAFGALVVTAAEGTIAVAGATPAAGTIVGRVVESGGIAAGATGKVLLVGAGV